MPIAYLFPGQGSQTPEMRADVAALRPDLLDRVHAAVGEDPFPRAGEATRFAQPAIFCASLAGLERLGGTPDAMAGHSLGELTAFVAAGALSEDDGLRLVALRGRLMDAAPAGTMTAVLGGEREDVVDVAARHGVALANDNGPGQIVLSGAVQAVRAAEAELRAAGIRTLELPVAGAFHSPLMEPAVAPFAAALAATDIGRPRVPVWSCVIAAPVHEPDAIRRVLATGLTAPVRWREVVERLFADGIDDVAEVGPGAVLTKLVKRIARATGTPDPGVAVAHV